MSFHFAIIAAMDQKRGIGKGNALPWHFPKDLKHFKELTEGGTVIMGRKTWESLPERFRPLKGRLNIVVTHNSDYSIPVGVLLAHSLAEALDLAERQNADHPAFVIGGATLYKEAIIHSACIILYLTEIQAIFDCDAFFPEIPPDFKPVQSEEAEEASISGPIKLRFMVYKK